VLSAVVRGERERERESAESFFGRNESIGYRGHREY
jgi:hypothetical protein